MSAEDVALFNQTILQYTTSSIAKWIHEEAPRRNRHFQKVDNEFQPDKIEYWEGVASIAAVALALAVLTLLFFTIRALVRFCMCCLGCCCFKPNKRFVPRSRCIIWTFFFTAVIVIGGIVYGFLSNQTVSRGVKQVRDAISDMDDLKDFQVDAARQVVNSLSSIAGTAGTLLDQLEALNDTITLPQSVFTSVDTVQSQMNSGIGDVNKGIDQYANLPISDVVDNIRKYDHYRYLGQLAILLFLALPYIVMAFAFLCNSKFFAWNVLWVGVLSSVFGWLLSGLESSAVVVLSDACIDPSGYIIRQANTTSRSILPYVEFFVVCKDLENPLQDELNSATNAIDDSQDALNQLSDYVAQLETYANITLTEFYEVNRTMTTLTTEASNVLLGIDRLLLTVFKCNRIHNNYVNTLDGICGGTLEGFFALVIVQGAMAFLTLVAIYCSIQLFKFLKNKNFAELLSNDVELVDEDKDMLELVGTEYAQT